ncbi:MAG: hypothetical protein ACX93N_05920 [Pseudohaliea sp.]
MRPSVLTALCLCGFAAAAPFAAPDDDCGAIVATTIEELRVAAGKAWDGGQEALARRAAAAACVKARSGRYDVMASEAVGPRSAEAAARTGAEDGASAAEAKDDDGGLWPFGEFKINDVSASPSRKPYERRRLDNDD